MDERRIEQLSKSLNIGFQVVGSDMTLKIKSNGDSNIYGETKGNEYDDYSLRCRANISPDKEELSDLGVEKGAEIILIVPVKQLEDKGLLDTENLMDLPLETLAVFKGREFEVVNIEPKSQVYDKYFEFHFECVRR